MIDIGGIEVVSTGSRLLTAEDVTEVTAHIERIESENEKLRGLCKELLDLCYDAYEQKWGWDDDWALSYEQAKKLGVEVRE